MVEIRRSSSRQRTTVIGWGSLAGRIRLSYHHVGQGILTITKHPQVIGRGHRLLFLERCIRHMAGHPGVTFATIADYVRYWRKGRKPELPRDAGPARSKAWGASASALAPAAGRCPEEEEIVVAPFCNLYGRV